MAGGKFSGKVKGKLTTMSEGKKKTKPRSKIKHFRSDKTIRDPPGDLSDFRYRDRRIRSLCIRDKRSGDLHVSEDTVCFPGLQRVADIFLYRLSGYDGAVYLDRPLSVRGS